VRSWELVGDLDVNGGIEWYNTTGIVGKPGDQLVGDIGWSGKDTAWVAAAFNLDVLKGQPNVRFRIAIGTNADNAPGEDFNGFAFDDILIGERSRNVLVEHFTNINEPEHFNAKERLNNIDNIKSNIGIFDMIPLQYHTEIPSSDQYNKDNEGDPSARALVYGVQTTPRTVVDGNVYNDNSFQWTSVTIDKRVIVTPQFDIQIVEQTANSDQIQLEITVTSNINLAEQVVVYAAIIEEKIITSNNDTIRNVVKKILPGADGTLINRTWAPGTTEIISLSPWDINVRIYDSTQLAAIVFVQNRDTREMYQAEFIKLGTKNPPLIVGLEDELRTELENIKVYPNPASNQLNLSLDSQLGVEYSWRIIDQRGVIIQNGNLSMFNGTTQIDTRDIKNGIYFLILGVEERPMVYKKIAIMHQ